MGFLRRLSAPSTEDGEKIDGFPFMWKDYPSKLFNMSGMRHPWVKLLLFINDSEHDKHNAKKPTFVVRKTLPSEWMMHFHPIRISMTFSRISQTRFTFDSSWNQIYYWSKNLRFRCDLLRPSWMLQSCYWAEKETSRMPHMEADTIMFYIYTNSGKRESWNCYHWCNRYGYRCLGCLCCSQNSRYFG